VGLSDTLLKGTHPETIPARFGLIWFSSFIREDLNVIFYQIMPIFTNSFHSISALDSTPNNQFSGASENITGHLSVQVNDENCG
jgi:hypothetical protein